MSFHLEQQHPTKHAERIERDHSGKSNAVPMFTATLFATAAILITLFSIYLTLILQWEGPFRDLWEFVDDIERQFNGEWSLHYLFEAYGGAHRIFLPKLLFFLDYYWLDGRNQLTIAIALLCQFGYLLLIIRLLLQQISLNTAERIIITAAFALALFSTTQVSNFLYAMDVQWYLSNLLGLASLYALAQPTHSRHKWFAVFLFGIAAALCNFTGLMTLPVAGLALLLNRKAVAWRWLLLLLIAAICLLYVSHEKNSQHVVIQALQKSDNWRTSLYILFNTAQDMALYMLRYLASPLSREWPIAGNALSITGLAITLYYWFQHLENGGKLSSWQRLCLYISTYIVASAFFTAFGRIIYPNSATAERYQTLVLPWLPALFGLIWIDLRNSRYANLFLLVWLMLFGCYLLPTQPVSARNMVILSQRVNLAHTAARAAVLEPPYILATLSHPLIKNGINSVKDNDIFLRSHSLGYFHQLPQFSLDKKVEPDNTLPSCTGHNSLQLDAATQSWIIDGQLLAKGKSVSDIILLQNNIVIGIGMQVGSDNSFLPAQRQPAETSRFRAFARVDHLQKNEQVTALGVAGNQVLCSHILSH